MSDDSVTAIDDKTTDTGGSDWNGFAKSLLKNLIFIILFTIIGSNYIFFINFDYLNIIFPTDLNQYFFMVNKNLRMTDAQKANVDKVAPQVRVIVEKLDSMGYTKMDNSWPYSMKKDIMQAKGRLTTLAHMKTGKQMACQSYDQMLINDFSMDGMKDWFNLTIANTFITYRMFMKFLFTGALQTYSNVPVKNVLKKVSQPLIYILGSIVFVMLLLGVLPFITFISTIIYSLTVTKWAWFFSIVGFIFWYTPGIATANVIIQYLSFLYNFIIVPFLIDYESVGKIVYANSKWISFLFGLLVLRSAYTFLNSNMFYGMIIAYVFLLLEPLIYK